VYPGLDWTGLNWIELDWTGLPFTGAGARGGGFGLGWVVLEEAVGLVALLWAVVHGIFIACVPEWGGRWRVFVWAGIGIVHGSINPRSDCRTGGGVDG
jgi:hypothetical protein